MQLCSYAITRLCSITYFFYFIVCFCDYAGVRLGGCATVQSQRYASMTIVYLAFFFIHTSLTQIYASVPNSTDVLQNTYTVILDDLLFCVVAGAKI